MNKQKLMDLLVHPEYLAPVAYATLPGNPKQLIIVANGETGYYVCGEFDTEEQAKQVRDGRNEILGVSEEEREALVILSMKFN